MREMEWIFCKPLETTEPIEEYEKNADFTFPETYKECVKQYAYGRPKGMVFKTKEYGDVTFRLYTFVKESQFLSIWDRNGDYPRIVSNLEREREQKGLTATEELRLKNYNYIAQNYILFGFVNAGGELAFNKTDGSIVFFCSMALTDNLKTEIIADSFDEFIEEKLYKRERTGVYDDIEWNHYIPLKSESLIEEYEKAINYTFPESFKECVKKYNGAASNDYIFDINSYDATEFTFQSFNKEDDDSIWTLLSWYDEEEMFENITKDYVIFADNFFGNFLTFKRSNGAVVYWEHDSMYHKTVGKNFDDFLSKVYLNKEILYVI